MALKIKYQLDQTNVSQADTFWIDNPTTNVLLWLSVENVNRRWLEFELSKMA